MPEAGKISSASTTDAIGTARTKMATVDNLSSDINQLSICPPEPGSSVSLRHPSTSSEGGWQSMRRSSTPASSVFSEDFDANQDDHPKTADPKARTKQNQKAAVIYEEGNSAAELADTLGETELTAYAEGSKSPEELEALPFYHYMDSPTLPISPSTRIRQPVEYELPYTHPNMPWDRLYSSRADYPRSMFTTFLNYHHGPLDTVHDLGAGSGLAADGLLSALRLRLGSANAQMLPRTILSDPGEANLAVSARFLTARQPGVPLECWPARGEEQDRFLVPSSVDLTLCAEALHWMDTPVALSQTARSLRPGGTLAVVLYSCFPRILNDGRTKRAVRMLVEDHLRYRMLKKTPDDGADGSSDDEDDHRDGDPDSPGNVRIHPNWARGMRSLAYGLDAVELPADQWEDIRRFEINCGAAGWWWPNASKDTLGCATPRADASPHERFVYEDYEDWGRWASLRELKELLMSIQVGFGDKTWDSPLWRELETSVKGPLHLVWQVHMILARKKSPSLQTVPEEP